MSNMIVHRDYEGEHDTNSDACWCRPVEVDPDTLRDVEEIVEETNALDG